MKRLTRTLGLLALAACSSAPPASQAPPQQAWVPTPPVYALIGQRQDLNLTSAQVTALDSIGAALQRQNSPMLTELRELQQASGGFRRRPSPEATERARPLIDSLRENNRTAQEAVRALLSEEQRTRVCRISGPDRDDARRRQARQQQQPRQRGIGPDTTVNVFRGPWTWCGNRGTSAPAPGAAFADTTARPDTTAPPRP
ncbi:MAG TPA: Spy/CpxP family protein refolding chaperone [Longimicrobiaceae bacterium]|nr:Spy/CpxP family protein refolding chaperone [Longimicrobiaceae bacterium]